MKVYQLRSRPTEADSEGEDYDEWFLSLEMAKRRRRTMIAESEANIENLKYFEDHEIICHEVKKLRLPELVLCLLKRRGWAKESTEVVSAHKFTVRSTVDVEKA